MQRHIKSKNPTRNKKTIQEPKHPRGVLSTKEKTTTENLRKGEGEHPMIPKPHAQGFNPHPKLLFFEYFSLNTTIFGTGMKIVNTSSHFYGIILLIFSK